MQGAGAKAQERASEVVRQNEQHLESAFGLLSLTLAALGSVLLFIPDKAWLLTLLPLAMTVSHMTFSFVMLVPHHDAAFPPGAARVHPAEAEEGHALHWRLPGSEHRP